MGILGVRLPIKSIICTIYRSSNVIYMWHVAMHSRRRNDFISGSLYSGLKYDVSCTFKLLVYLLIYFIKKHTDVWLIPSLLKILMVSSYAQTT